MRHDMDQLSVESKFVSMFSTLDSVISFDLEMKHRLTQTILLILQTQTRSIRRFVNIRDISQYIRREFSTPSPNITQTTSQT